MWQQATKGRNGYSAQATVTHTELAVLPDLPFLK